MLSQNFSIEIFSNVPEKVSSKIQSMGLRNASVSTSGEAITFTFNNDLSERSGDSSGGNGANEQKTCTEDATICGIWQSCVDGECVCDKSKCQALCPKTGDKCAELYPTAAIGFNINYDNYPEGMVCEGDLSTDTELRLPGGGCWNGALSVAFDGCVCHYDAD